MISFHKNDLRTLISINKNDLPKFNNSQTIIYADDTVLLCTHKNCKTFKEKTKRNF